MSLASEAVVVGAVLAAALAAAWSVAPFRSAGAAALAGFVVGVAVHLGFEAAGANKWYCRHGAACA